MSFLKNNNGIFIFGFGAPRSLDKSDLAAFLRCVTGREPSDEAVEGLFNRYVKIGGQSPLLKIMRAQTAALEREIGADGKVFIGVRCGEPSIKDAIEQAAKSGVKHAVAFTHAPQYSSYVAQSYIRAAESAITEIGADMTVDFVESYGLHPLFIEEIKTRLTALLNMANLKPEDTPVIFTAHSLPVASGGTERYVSELEGAAKIVSEKLNLQKSFIAFQSPGRAGGKWLEPSLETVIEKVAKDGHKAVVVFPIGFIAENLETLYDLDVVASQHAQALSLNFYRIDALNDSPALAKAWLDMAKRKIEAWR